MKRLFSVIALLMTLALYSIAETASAADLENPEVWKNEGVFTPLTPFESIDWSEETYAEFELLFANWAEGMEQSYYHIEDEVGLVEAEEVNPLSGFEVRETFRDFNFENIVKNAFDDGYKIGFTYHNRDYRSDFDNKRYDIFTVLGSDQPDQKHLYIFAVETEELLPVVFYIDGDAMIAGEKFAVTPTENAELTALYEEAVSEYIASSGLSQSEILSEEEFLALSDAQRNDFCMATPWYDVPNGWCSDAGVSSFNQEYMDAVYEYGRKYDTDIDTAFRVMGYVYLGEPEEDSPYYFGWLAYQEYLQNPEYYTEIDGVKHPITLPNSDFNGDGILTEEEMQRSREYHTY